MAGTKSSANEPKQLTMDEIRTLMSEEIYKIREQTTTAANVNAISNAVGKILNTVKLEMEYYRLIGKTPNIPLLLRPGDSVEAV